MEEISQEYNKYEYPTPNTGIQFKLRRIICYVLLWHVNSQLGSTLLIKKSKAINLLLTRYKILLEIITT